MVENNNDVVCFLPIFPKRVLTMEKKVLLSNFMDSLIQNDVKWQKCGKHDEIKSRKSLFY